MGMGLLGRAGECQALDRLVASARAGQSRVLVLRGEAGVGKTALLDYVGGRAGGCRLARRDRRRVRDGARVRRPASALRAAPGPRRRAAGPAARRPPHGVRPQHRPGRRTGSWSVWRSSACWRTLAEEQPLICLIDDAQWLDRVSAQTLAFVARRLLAEPVAVVFAVREPADDEDLAGLPDLLGRGVSATRDARTLLDSAITGPLDERVRDRIVAETRGNPLALLELPRGLTPAELAGGFGLPDTMPLASRIEHGLPRGGSSRSPRTRGGCCSSPPPSRSATRRCCGVPRERLGIPAEAAAPAVGAGLLEIGARVRFRHPLVRSAVYRAARSANCRRRIARSPRPPTRSVDPDRRAWHRAHAAARPDEAVAAELERSAGRAQGRGGVAAAAAFLERAAALTPDPARAGARALDAAQAKLRGRRARRRAAPARDRRGRPAGRAPRARIDLAARADRVRARAAAATRRRCCWPPPGGSSRSTPRSRGETLPRRARGGDVRRAPRRGTQASAGGRRRTGRAAAAGAPRAVDLLLDGLAVAVHGRATQRGVPPLGGRSRRSARRDDRRRGAALALAVAAARSRPTSGTTSAGTRSPRARCDVARETGALSVLPLALDSRIVRAPVRRRARLGGIALDRGGATRHAGDRRPRASYGAPRARRLAGPRGRDRRADRGRHRATRRAGEGIGLIASRDWAQAVLLQRPRPIRGRARAPPSGRPSTTSCRASELGAGGARRGRRPQPAAPEVAADALERLEERTRASGTDWALGDRGRARGRC